MAASGAPSGTTPNENDATGANVFGGERKEKPPPEALGNAVPGCAKLNGDAAPPLEPKAPVDGAASAELPKSQSKGGLSLGDVYEEVVGDNVGLVRAHTR